MSGKRVLALYAAVLLGFAVVLCRLYFLAENHTYAARAEAQSTVRLSLPARRGSFYDHSGLLLTGLETRYLALCFPGENNYTRLYAFTDSAGQALLYRNRNRSAPFLLEVDRDLSGRGIRCFATARRCAEVPLCQHLIGYLDAEGRGIAGLEKALDSQLAGTKEHDTLVCAVTAQGRLRAGETPQLTRQDSSAVGVQLTISRPVQRAAEAVAADTMTSGCILVLDTATAAVRASVSVPGYDPDDLAASLDAPDSPFLNRALESYAVGSVFKPVLAAAALEQGILPECECTGAVVVDGQIFRCAGGVPHGTVDLTAALEKSCNGYFIRLGQQLGAETLLQMSRQLGFGQEVPVAGALHADAGKLPGAVVQQRVDQRAVRVAGGRMHHHALGLVDDDQIVILVDDIQRDVLGLGLDGLRFRQVDTVGSAGDNFVFFVDAAAAAGHSALLHQVLQGAAGKLGPLPCQPGVQAAGGIRPSGKFNFFH